MNYEKKNILKKGPEEYSHNVHHYASPQLLKDARDLRKRTTKAEDVLWIELKNKKLAGKKFRRQHALYKFVADFYCHECKLVIELDGKIHTKEEIKERDESRTYALEQFGLKIIRFTNEEVLNNLKNVLITIKNHLT